MHMAEPRFDWDAANVEKIDRDHGVQPEEAEEALSDPYLCFAPAYPGPGGEKRQGAIGATEDGRILFVVFTRRGQLLRVVTAYDAPPGYKQRYRQEARRKGRGR
jgi:uncharacterized protein